jgi:hypothetical protein
MRQDGDVAIADRTLDMLGGHHADIDLRLALGKSRQARHQPMRRIGEVAADGEMARRVAGAEACHRTGDLLQPGAGGLHELAPVLGQFDAAGRAAEQRPAQALLDLADLAADGGLGHAEGGRGGGETTPFPSRHHREQRRKRGQVASDIILDHIPHEPVMPWIGVAWRTKVEN